jgi:methionine sulfoxide reductase heme-binding subunit
MIALWYASRATGLVSQLLLTAVMVLGAANGARLSSHRWPRFAVAALHRNLSLLTVAFLAIHIATAIIDTYAGIEWITVVVPFVSHYEPFWLGLGTVAFDLLVALVLSSLARPRINPGLWRLIHWAAYACWPSAVIHGFGIGGADSRLVWVRVLDVVCVLIVVVAVWLRTGVQHADTEARRRPFEKVR